MTIPSRRLPNGYVRSLARTGKCWTEQLPPVVSALKPCDGSARISEIGWHSFKH